MSGPVANNGENENPAGSAVIVATVPSAIADKELEQYRNLLQTPTEFKDGFGWTTVSGILFCGLVMMPGSIYLSLMTGQSMGTAAVWVTVILFSQIAKRALRTLSRQNLVVLLHAANIMMAGSAGIFGDLVYRAYFVRSDAVRDAGMRDAFPSWWAPHADSAAILQRNLFHPDWLVPIGIAVFVGLIGVVQRYSLGYFLFRLTSDVENLPFPLAPVTAQGAMAMSEEDEPSAPVQDESVSGRIKDFFKSKGAVRKSGDKWRLFSLGATFGIAFGLIQIGVPAITGLFLDHPFFLLPQPFLDTTTLTESILPATPTGIVIDVGIILIGLVLPFWAVMGTFVAIAITMLLNPVLHHTGVLNHWQQGMDTVNTTFSNSIDFWMSFGIGTGFGIAAISVFSTIRDVRRKLKELRANRHESAMKAREDMWAPPRKGRGDYPIWLAIALYCVTALLIVVLSYVLLPRNGTLLAFMVFFSFVYNPFISYVNARLLGIAGQTVDIPFVKETSFILSGARGVELWLAPVPLENFGGQAQAFRVNELTGVSFWSLIKTELVAIPISMILSLCFWSFIWSAEAVPSAAFPAARINWQMQSKNQALIFSSTMARENGQSNLRDSEFMKAVHPAAVGSGFGATIVIFGALSYFGLPVMLVYGMIRGFGQLPHTMVLEIIGALIGRYYLQKKFGPTNFLRMAPTILAGYFTGVGLISMTTIALKLIIQAVSSAPF